MLSGGVKYPALCGWMEDVFDLTGHSPEGWTHAIFCDGPFADDVGRCLPGPPTADPLEVELPDGSKFVYRILTVGFLTTGQEPMDDLLVIYAGRIPEDSEETQWWADRTGGWIRPDSAS